MVFLMLAYTVSVIVDVDVGGSDSEAEKEKISDLEDQIIKLQSNIDSLKDKNNVCMTTDCC